MILIIKVLFTLFQCTLMSHSSFSATCTFTMQLYFLLKINFASATRGSAMFHVLSFVYNMDNFSSKSGAGLTNLCSSGLKNGQMCLIFQKKRQDKHELALIAELALIKKVNNCDGIRKCFFGWPQFCNCFSVLVYIKATEVNNVLLDLPIQDNNKSN